jgi:hypothetical protein
LFCAWKRAHRGWGAVRSFTDPDEYFAGIRNLQIDGVITKRGEFRAESTRIDLHRLWMHRFDESLPRLHSPPCNVLQRRGSSIRKIRYFRIAAGEPRC